MGRSDRPLRGRFRGSWGGWIRTVCMECGTWGRHKVGGPERLKARNCTKCGGRHRPLWWVKKYRQRAVEEAAPLALAKHPTLKWAKESLDA